MVKQLFLQFERYVDMLTLRERLLLLAVVMLVVFFLWFTFLWRPISTNRMGMLTQISSSEIALEAGKKELQAAQEQLRVFAQQKSVAKQEVVKYENKTELEKLLAEYENSIISPQTMKETLQNILEERQDLEMLQLKMLPTTDIVHVRSGVMLYQFGFMLKVKGTYFSVMHFLEDIEKLDWRIYWSKLEYKVDKYPYAEVTIELHSVGTREG